jgi:pullulanase
MRRIVLPALLLSSLATAFCQTPLIVRNFPDGLGARDDAPGGSRAIAQSLSTESKQLLSLQGDFLKFQAFWIDRNTILISSAHLAAGNIYRLHSDSKAGLELNQNAVTGGTSSNLICCGTLTQEERTRFPQLATGYAVLKLPSDMTEPREQAFLRGQLVVSAERPDGSLSYATGVQDAGVLDDLYFYPGELGVIIRHSSSRQDDGSGYVDDADGDLQVRVWAPTAQAMSLQLFLKAEQATPSRAIAMHEHGGVWVAVLDRRWIGHYYLFDETVYAPSKRAIVENIVTDPYSIDLAINGTKSRITDMDADPNVPKGWRSDQAPALAQITDLSIYELHVRDFSVADRTVPAIHRGTYLAFTDHNSDGMKHLQALAGAGLKAVHLLPTFHFGSVDENKSAWKTTDNLAHYQPDGKEQQAAVAAIQAFDGYNWGYDPVHYLAPQGSYAVNPYNRVREYRSMVMALHRSGLRVIQDMVFNHTSGFGQAQNSVLDKVVPNYYNRLDADGGLLTSTCCADTATEHLMMGKLQQDAILWNAREYKIDGFRFDLMGFTFTKNLEQIRDALRNITLAKDGIDGSKIYLYGEGWEFGETANNGLGENATQSNLHGTGIGSFNDRLRDGVRGGKVTDGAPQQGFVTGLFTDSSGFTARTSAPLDQRNVLLRQEDWIRIGLAGNLRDYQFMDAEGKTVTAAQVEYYGKPAGYAAAPEENVNYVSAHDNQTLFDAIQIKSPESDTAAVRARRQVLAMSLVTLGQGIPFFMAGDDLLRSKDMDPDSYDSGDWFNKIDWSAHDNNWGIGLPPGTHSGSEYAFDSSLLRNPSLKPNSMDIQSTASRFREFLQIRYSSPLFRMATLEEVQQHLHFLNTGSDQIPGVIAMELNSDDAPHGLYRHILVVFNATTSEQTLACDCLRGLPLRLHPVQLHSVDPKTRSAAFQESLGAAIVPPLSTAVFVSSQ